MYGNCMGDSKTLTTNRMPRRGEMEKDTLKAYMECMAKFHEFRRQQLDRELDALTARIDREILSYEKVVEEGK